MDSARGRREVIRQLDALPVRLDATEKALVDAQPAMKRAETALDTANDRIRCSRVRAQRSPRPAGPGSAGSCY